MIHLLVVALNDDEQQLSCDALVEPFIDQWQEVIGLSDDVDYLADRLTGQVDNVIGPKGHTLPTIRPIISTE